jgi:hypothetical protein
MNLIFRIIMLLVLKVFGGLIHIVKHWIMNSWSIGKIQRGGELTGEMPQRLDIMKISHPMFGIIPLNEQIVFQGPGNERQKAHDLWGKREEGDNKTHNFNSYHIPVPSGFNVDLFQTLAEGHEDMQMFELLRYGFLLEVRGGI